MALSEREQRLLDEMERGLYAGDPKFTRAVQNPRSVSAKRLIAGALVAVIGLSLLLFAVIIQLVVFGVLGFLVMLGGVILASSRISMPEKANEAKPSRPRSTFEDRWNSRFEG